MATFAQLIVSGEADYVDAERDMNTKFLQFDKALRSNKVGEQCEAIVEIQKSLNTIQFPSYINAAFLKFADIFRIGSNILRLCIFRATHQSENQLSKISNVDEFLRKIFSVTHSNDPIARAITIRLLGSAARILSECKNVQHCLLSGLQSNDSVEVEAAVWATAAFSAQSKSFALCALDQLSQMISDLSTPISLKLKLVSILRHMHYSANMTQKVRELGTQLLNEYPTRGFVLVTLHMLSQLAVKSLTNIPEQIALLEKYLIDDHRRAVKHLCLENLGLLAKHAPHMWESKDIKPLCDFILKGCSENLQLLALKVLDTLSSSVAISKFNTTDDSAEIRCCNMTAYHIKFEIATLGTALMVNMAVGHKKSDLLEQASIALETLLSILLNDASLSSPALTKCPRLIIHLCSSCPSIAGRFIDLICTLLPSAPVEKIHCLCECLLAIGSHHKELLAGLIPDITDIIVNANSQHTSSSMLSLTTLLLQASACDGVTDDVHAVIMQSLVKFTQWDVYRVGRQAARYGHHKLAAAIFADLCSKVASEQHYGWVNGLQLASEAESSLACSDITLPKFVSKINQSQILYHQSIAAINASTTSTHSHSFQIEYLKLRTKLLQAFQQVFSACCSFKTSPPPAIATSLAVTTGNDVHKSGHVVTQMKRCAKLFVELQKDYSSLYSTAFDADDSTLSNIKIQEQNCHLMSRVLETLSDSAQKAGSKKFSPELFREASDIFSGQQVPTECQRWEAACEKVFSLVQQVAKGKEIPSLSYQQVQCIERSAIALCSAPLCLPRFFFQRLRHTEIKLAVTPSPQSAIDTISVHYDTHLTLSIEGIISQNTQIKSCKRHISQVKVHLTSTQQSRGQLMAETKYTEGSTMQMVQIAEPKNDYFSCKALLHFPMPGLHQVTIDTVVVDNVDQEWKTGPRKTFMVKSYDEAVQRQQQQLYAQQRQQQRAAQQQLQQQL